MIHYQSFITILGYFAICTFLIGQSLMTPQSSKESKKNQVQEESLNEFKQAKYFQKVADTPQASLDAVELISGDLTIKVRKPVGEVFPSENEKLEYIAEYAEFAKAKKELDLRGDVYIKHLQGDMKCDRGKLLLDQKYAQCFSNVKSNILDLENGDKLKVDANLVKMWWERGVVQYTGNVVGKINRKYKYEPGLDFSSEQLIFNRSDLNAEFEGNVKFNYQGVKSRSGRAELYLENYNKELKYYVLYDDIEIEQKIPAVGGGETIRKAYSETLEAFNQQRKIVLKGAPRVTQGRDITRGYKITLFLDREIMEVDNSSSVIKINE